MPSGPPLRGDDLVVRMVFYGVIFVAAAGFTVCLAIAGVAELVRGIVAGVTGV